MMPTMMRTLFVTSPMLRGDDVLMVQSKLFGPGPARDGLYGRGTAGAVEHFQAANRLEADGIVGALTWGKLFGGGGVSASDVLEGAGAGLGQFHRQYADSVRWRLTADGVEVENEGPPQVTSQDRGQANMVLTRFRSELVSVLAVLAVPIELVVATVCAESGGDPSARRYEPGCNRNNPGSTPERISFGLTQTLLSTARDVLHRPDLRLEELETPQVSLLAGATYISHQSARTRFDPPLVAAAYNAGSIRYNASPLNRWRLVQYPIGTSKHVDRFVAAFNATMQLVDGAGIPEHIPSLRRQFRTGSVARAALAATAGPVAAGPYVAVSPQSFLGRVVDNGQCVRFVQEAAPAPHTSYWRRGPAVTGNADVASGTVIATFDPDGSYGNHEDGRSHAAIYVSQSGEGLDAIDQWVGQPVHQRLIRFGGEKPANDGTMFHVVI